ncbi:unnamed protein product [Dracunculus medinensis]|uniref:ShTK domain protein n=1 Tax=Dracunculus medinensis TaxID=318479 RepID=A0A0N4UH71_DRAME|nr:unnamed protein product [Dracunculus medinensis]
MATNSRRRFQQEADNNIWLPTAANLRPIPAELNARGQYANNPYDCMTLNCLCPHFFVRNFLSENGRMGSERQCVLPNGQPLTMGLRKEYRMLTENELNRWHNALAQLKLSGEYDRLGFEHQGVGTGSGAHSGPGFLPWHREYLKRFEIALRLIDPSIAIPYWDSAMDNYLFDPRDSIIFSPIFAGEVDVWGNVINGPFAFWRTLDGRNSILRNMGQEGALYSEFSIGQVMQQTNLEYVMAYTAPLLGCPYPVNFGALEYSHSNVHLWVGGHMREAATSTNDPLFYMHHSFVDFIWELWRQMRQPRWVRESAYTPDLPQCADPQHFSYAVMRPYFNLINRDGLSNLYTDQLYRYAARPGCSREIPTCGSQYLFCDTRGSPHCVSKIKFGGICTGFEGFDACYNGNCIMERCVPGPTPAPFVLTTQPLSTTQRRSQSMRSNRTFAGCFNRSPCCEQWSRKGACRRNRNYMRQFCRAACGICRPTYNINDECADRHSSCRKWGLEGQCQGNSGHFMEENCRTTCNLCRIAKNTSCSSF